MVDPVKLLTLQSSSKTVCQALAVYEILEIEPDIVDKQMLSPLMRLRIKNVAFNTMMLDVFRNINLKVKAGEYIALVGSSGVGKTTMCSLIPRFYEVSEGLINIDGIDIKDIAELLRKNRYCATGFICAGTVMPMPQKKM